MAQFGADPSLVAQCPKAPTPDGWRPWTDADGPVPDALSKRASAMAADTTVPLGTTESYPLPGGIVTLIRVEPHVWGRDATGTLVQGCFRAAMIYLPSGAPEGAGAVTPPTPGNLNKAVAVLTVVSLVVGTTATIASWGGK